MEWFWSFLFYSLPWYWQVALLALLVGVPGYFLARMILGPERANRLLLPILGALAALGFASKIRQSGYNDRRAEEEKALDHAEEIVEDERTDVQKLPDVEVNKEIDEWTRK